MHLNLIKLMKYKLFSFQAETIILVEITEKYNIPRDKTYDEVIEALETKMSDYRVELNKCFKSKAAIQKMSMAASIIPAYEDKQYATMSKTLNNEISDYKNKIEDLEDDILALKQYENPQSNIFYE